MSPVAAAISRVNRAIGSFHPAAMPPLTRGHYRREIVAWIFLPMMMGAVEGGVVGVIAKNAFADTVPARWLNIAVAILSGAPAFANVTSVLWAAWSHGRDKIRFLVALQVVAVVLVAAAGLAPHRGAGLAMLVLAAVGARMCWAGVVTLRSTVWRANYPRSVRATMAGRLATVQAIVLGAVGVIIGLAMTGDDRAYHWIYPLAATFGLVGALVYRRMRMRGHAALIAGERREAGVRAPVRLPLVATLRDDPDYRRYMIAMFIFGIGNVMVTAPLVIMLRDVFDLGYLAGIMITTTIPVIVMPFVIPLWSRLLDRVHIVRFRACHCWAFVASTTMFLAAGVLHLPLLLWGAAACKGVAFAGGVLAWNLGHHDYAPRALASRYMGVHVTLTGVRGLVGPPVAVLLYEALATRGPDAGSWVFAVCLALNLVGAAAFIRLAARVDGTERQAD